MCRVELTPYQVKKKRAGICVVPFCTGKIKQKYGLKCYSCRKKEWAARNPEKYIFANLRGNAKRRKKEFGLKFDEFKAWLHKEKYLEKIRGRKHFSVSIDRRENKRGYFIDNLQAITIRANSEKMHYVDYFRNQYEHEDSQTENPCGALQGCD